MIKIQAENRDGGGNPGSPIIDVEGMSDENEEEEGMEYGAGSADDDQDETSEDQKVLSLAEQFIAAMPARIKTQSNDGPSTNGEGATVFHIFSHVGQMGKSF